MTGRRRYEELPLAARRRLAVRAVVRPAATTACLMAVYFVVPLNSGFTVATAFALAGCLLAFALVVAWQAYAISRSAYPRLRALETLAVIIPVFVLLFAAAYVVMAGEQGAFSEPLSRTDALYFTLEVFSTVGLGDITPRSPPARVLTIVQMLGDLLVIGLAARILVEAARRGGRRRPRPGGDQP